MRLVDFQSENPLTCTGAMVERTQVLRLMLKLMLLLMFICCLGITAKSLMMAEYHRVSHVERAEHV